MKIIEFESRGQIHKMFVDDDFNWNKSIRIDRDGYAIVSYKRKNTMLHRLIVDAPKGMQVDHINGNKLDNRKENLRIVTPKQNSINRKAKGAYYSSELDKWKTHVYKDGKIIHLGYFDTKEEAQEVYRKAHVELHGEFSPYFSLQ